MAKKDRPKSTSLSKVIKKKRKKAMKKMKATSVHRKKGRATFAG